MDCLNYEASVCILRIIPISTQLIIWIVPLLDGAGRAQSYCFLFYHLILLRSAQYSRRRQLEQKALYTGIVDLVKYAERTLT